MSEDITKIAAKVRKLLALANDGGATEAEADTALRMAQQIMADNNLSMATVAAQGGSEGEDAQRDKQEARGRAMYQYQRNLMVAICEVNFCMPLIITTGHRSSGYRIIGRRANVASVMTMFDYLTQTINRLVMVEVGGDNRQRMSRRGVSFAEGVADRLRERLSQRHKEYLERQAQEARERNAAARHTAAMGNALVVVMRDYAQEEQDRNEDFRRGVPPGTTEKERGQAETVRAARERARRDRQAELEAQGIEPDVAYYMSYGYSREDAEQAAHPKPETAAQERARKAREERARERMYARWNRESERRDWTAYDRGQQAADRVGLDQQVPHKTSGRIG